ncbi:MAG TPA: beta-galactosidase [Isosphaeraceae bacterium]|nr:beta-galactosidase [Isosphaeraceae bacterium]
MNARGSGTGFIAAIGAILALTIGGPALAADPPFRTVAIGIGEDYASNRRTVEAARSDLETCKKAGVTVLRISFSWAEIETEPGKYDFDFYDKVIPLAVDTYGMRLVPYVCYTPMWASADPASKTVWTTPPKDNADFGRFVRKLVGRYKDRLHSWEIWNEPDIPEFWTGTTSQYAALLREGSRAVRETDPKAKVVLAGMAKRPEFLRELFEEENLSKFVDIINCHSYFETWHGDPLEEIATYIRRIARVVDRYGDGQEIWMAEVGYSNFRPSGSGRVSDMYRARHAFEHTPEFQAEALVRSMALIVATRRVSLITWYRINDLPTDQFVIGDVNNRYLGVVDLQGRPKPALDGLRRAVRLFERPLRVIDDQVVISKPIASRAEVHCFEAKDGSITVVGWQHVSEIGDPKPDDAGNEEPRPLDMVTVWFPNRDLEVDANNLDSTPPGGKWGVVDRDHGTEAMLFLRQHRNFIVRLIPKREGR